MTILTKRLNLILFAGLAGGLAEIIWVCIYSQITGVGAGEISRQITATVLPVMADLSIATILGVIIHLLLSVLLALLFCTVFIGPVIRRFGHSGILFSSIVVLAGIWLINFLVILPVINPAFVTLLPVLVTLVSKLIFGLAMGSVFTYRHSDTLTGQLTD